MDSKVSSHGGRRTGSGKKPLFEGEVLAPVTIKMSSEQRRKLEQLGGAPWVRKKIDLAKIPKD